MRTRMFAAAFGLAAFAAGNAARADEGMWMPSQLPDISEQLKAAGFRGDPRALADLAKPPMNAVVKAGGATGAFVSKDGLVLTNHHVAFGVIQYNSNATRDLIGNGFIAADRAAELPANPDYRHRCCSAPSGPRPWRVHGRPHRTSPAPCCWTPSGRTG